MSSIQNVITTTFRARGNQAIATMGGISQGFGTIMQKVNETSRMSERLNNQWRALGTTFRYALAGSAVFGTIQLGRNLKDLQRQVGLLQALGEAQNGIFPNTNFPVTSLLADSRREALNAITPINDFNEGLINMFSSIQNVPENQAARMMREISLTAQLAQTDSESASKAIFGMMQTFRLEPNLENIQKASRAITELIASVPGGPEAGRQIFQQFPQLAAVIQMGRGTVPQMLGLYESLLRTGGTPATSGRGLQFLLQTVAFPEQQTKASRKALQSVGITPQYVERNGVVPAVLRLIEAIRTRGGISVSGPAKSLSDDDLEALADQAGSVTRAMSDLGISGAGNRLAAAAIPRIHGVRALALLAARPEQTIADLQSISDAWNGYGTAIQDHARRIKNLTDPQAMNQAAIAIQGVQQEVLLAFQPFINLASRGIIRAGKAAESHTDATQRTALGAGAVLALLGVGRFVGFRQLLGMGGRTFVTGKAIEDAATQGAMGLGASPQNPLYVIVVGELFGGGTKGPTTSVADTAIETYLGAKGVRRIGGLLRRGIRAATGSAVVDDAMEQGARGTRFLPIASKGIPIAGAVTAFLVEAKNAASEDQWIKNKRRAEQIFNSRLTSNQSIESVVGQPRLGKINGKAEVFLTIDVNDSQTGKTKRMKVHVPVNMWEGGRAPSTGGRAATKRAG